MEKSGNSCIRNIWLRRRIFRIVDLNRLGAVTTKGVANVPWAGNPTPRVAEVYGGMMNAIGLQNPGIDLFCERDIPYLKNFDTKIIVNVCGHAPEEYLAVVERLADEPIDMMEINISCPNVNAGFLAFGQDAHNVEKLTAQIKKIAKQPIIMKLTPNVTDITEIARAAEAGGADAVSLINTLTGMKIDINRKTFAVANKTGGVSGPIASRGGSTGAGGNDPAVLGANQRSQKGQRQHFDRSAGGDPAGGGQADHCHHGASGPTPGPPSVHGWRSHDRLLSPQRRRGLSLHA